MFNSQRLSLTPVNFFSSVIPQNIAPLASPPQRLQNTSTLIIPNIPWGYKAQK